MSAAGAVRGVSEGGRGERAGAGAGAGPTKKLINAPDCCVDENLRGLVAVYPQLRLHPLNRLVTIASDEESTNVAVLSGGGSGHEPFAAGYVGPGMLSGAVCGGIFTSPPPSHVLHAIKYLHHHNQGGVLVVIPNYTGDRLNFGMAIEKAQTAGLKVDSIIVDEDLASGQNSSTGARGMCGLTVIYKITGALSAEGASLSTVQQTAREVLNNMATFGVSLRACSLPGQAPLFDVAAHEMELGTGVHGEAGVSRAPFGNARDVTARVLERLADGLRLAAGDSVAALVNNMGAATTLEMNIVCGELAAYFKSRDIVVERLYSGHVMTCLDMHGFQVNVLRLPAEAAERALWLRLLDAPTRAPAWPGCALSLPSATNPVLDDDYAETESEWKLGPLLPDELPSEFRACLVAAAQALVVSEDALNRLDAGCGDGDCGSTLRNLAEAVLKYVQNANFERPARTLGELSEIAETDMGGTSGGIYSLGFAAASRALADESSITPATWSKAWNSANAAIMKYGRAKLGDRTLVDTLVPAAAAFDKGLHSGTLTEAIKATLVASEEGAKSTAAMKAGAGRASYVGSAHLGGEDAGARGAAAWLDAALGRLFRA